MSELLAAESIPSGQATSDAPNSTPDADQKSKKPWILPLWILFLALTSSILSVTLLSKSHSAQLSTPLAGAASNQSTPGTPTEKAPSTIKLLSANTIDQTPPFLTDEPNKTTNNVTPVPLALATNQNNHTSSESPTQPGASSATDLEARSTTSSTITSNPPQKAVIEQLSLLPPKAKPFLSPSESTIRWNEVLDRKATWKIQPYLMAGMANSLENTPQPDIAFKPFAGLGLEWQAPKWGLGISAQIQTRTRVDWESQFARNEATPLGYNSVVSQVTTKELAFIQINNYLFWRIKPRHRLQSGISLARIRVLKETPNIHTSTVTALDEQMSTFLVKSNQPGIRDWDLGATLGYQFQCSEHWQIQLLYQQGLFDLTADNWFGDVQNDLRSNLQIQLRYDF
ncbi:MAG: hypothetical protein AAGH79_00900 [Bacteroidota bacterium]